MKRRRPRLTHFEGGGGNRDKMDGRFKSAYWESNLPTSDPAVIHSAYRKARKVNLYGGRVARTARDLRDEFSGVPRERDAAGREKKREWEKAYFKQGAAALGTMGLGLYAHKSGLAKKIGETRGGKMVRRYIGLNNPEPLVMFDRWDDDIRSRDKRTAGIVGSALGGSALIGTGIGVGLALRGRGLRGVKAKNERLIKSATRLAKARRLERTEMRAEIKRLRGEVDAARTEGATAKAQSDAARAEAKAQSDAARAEAKAQSEAADARLQKAYQERSPIQVLADRISQAAKEAPVHVRESMMRKADEASKKVRSRGEMAADKAADLVYKMTPPPIRKPLYNPDLPKAPVEKGVSDSAIDTFKAGASERAIARKKKRALKARQKHWDGLNETQKRKVGNIENLKGYDLSDSGGLRPGMVINLTEFSRMPLRKMINATKALDLRADQYRKAVNDDPAARKEKRRQMRRVLREDDQLRLNGFARLNRKLTEFSDNDDRMGWGQRVAGWTGAGAGGALGAIPAIKKPWKAWAVGSIGAAAGYEGAHALFGNGKKKRKHPQQASQQDMSAEGGLRPGMVINLTEFMDPTRGDMVDADGRRVFRYTDVRGKSARIHRGDSRPRERREKEWWERADNQRKLSAAGMVASAGIGALAMRRYLVKHPDSLKVATKAVAPSPTPVAPVAAQAVRTRPMVIVRASSDPITRNASSPSASGGTRTTKKNTGRSQGKVTKSGKQVDRRSSEWRKSQPRYTDQELRDMKVETEYGHLPDPDLTQAPAQKPRSRRVPK